SDFKRDEAAIVEWQQIGRIESNLNLVRAGAEVSLAAIDLEKDRAALACFYFGRLLLHFLAELACDRDVDVLTRRLHAGPEHDPVTRTENLARLAIWQRGQLQMSNGPISRLIDADIDKKSLSPAQVPENAL